MQFLQNRFSLLLLATILATIIITSYGDNGVGKLAHLRREKRDLDAKIAKIRLENKRIRLEIQALNRDYVFIEKIAREELGMVRENEIVFLVPE